MIKQGFVYKTVNNINGKYYVGVRTLAKGRPDKDAAYLGSGTVLRHAVKKHGRENFTREIIHKGTTEECFELEEFIVDQEFLDNDKHYNIALGGFGGCTTSPERRKSRGIKISATYAAQGEEFKARTESQLAKYRLTMTADKAKEIYRNKTDAQKKAQNDSLVKAQQSAAKAKFIGVYHTPNGDFNTTIAAAKGNNCSTSTITNRCRKTTNPDKWINLGWRFTPVS